MRSAGDNAHIGHRDSHFDHIGNVQTSRRRFLGATLACAAAGVLVPACRCSREDSDQEHAARPTPPEVKTDDSLFAPPDSEPTIRVRLQRVRGADAAVQLGLADQWMRVTFDDATGRGLVMRGVIRATRHGDQWRVSDESTGTQRVFGARMLLIQPLGIEENTVALNQRQYSGLLRLADRSDLDEHAFDIINELPMEQYLPGVLARELFSHWEQATFAAQAVAARSFACYEHLHNRERRHYDVTDTVHSQAYVGAVNLEAARRAVRDTAGLVLGAEKLLVPGYYSSCCGGTAASANLVMGSNPANALPPLAGRIGTDVCTESPVYRWTIERDLSVLSRRIAAFGESQHIQTVAKLHTLRSIQPSGTGPTGRPTQYTLTDTNELTVALSAQRLRYAANHRATDLDDYGRSLPSSHVDVTIKSGVATFQGRGFGHGVGLCQYGAQALAKDGRGYLDILRWYYPGVSIVKAYDSVVNRRSILG